MFFKFRVALFCSESGPNWEVEIQDDVIDECNKHGGVLHIYVDKASPQGNVYVKCPTIAAAVASVQALHGRWFAGKVHYCGAVWWLHRLMRKHPLWKIENDRPEL